MDNFLPWNADCNIKDEERSYVVQSNFPRVRNLFTSLIVKSSPEIDYNIEKINCIDNIVDIP